VAAGGALGTVLRLGIDVLVVHTDATFPVSTLIVNTVGAFCLGLLVAGVWSVVPTWARAGLGVGLLGSFTTFSAVTGSLLLLAHNDRWMLAAAYLAATLILGLGAAALGLRLGSPRPTPIDLVDE
ncbi:MAG: CrcB family protein, partial [Rhodoglobus sp.]